MICDNGCVFCCVYYCAIKLEGSDAPSRHFQLVKKHTHTTHELRGKKERKKKRLVTTPPIYFLAAKN